MRTALSSNHFSHDTQLFDVISFLETNLSDLHAKLLAEFPEIPQVDLTREAWVDTEALGVDPEWTSWITDWVEDNAPVQWEDGEPWTCEVTMHGGAAFAIGDSEFFGSIEEAMNAWWERFESGGITRVDGVFYPNWGEMEADDTAISSEFSRITAGQIAWFIHTGRVPEEK